MAFHTVYAVIPLFLRELGAPSGIAVSVGGLFSFLIAAPQLISAIIWRNIRNLKLAVILVHLLVWIPLFIMGFIFTFFYPSGDSAWIFYLFLFVFAGLTLKFVQVCSRASLVSTQLALPAASGGPGEASRSGCPPPVGVGLRGA